MHYTRQGKGAPLLLVHGFPLDSRMWQNQIQELSNSFEFIVPDLRGFGQSPDLDKGRTVGDFAIELADLIRQLGFTSLQVCGLSLGGYIAFELVERNPELVSKLILCNTRASGDDELTARARRWMADRVQWDGTAFVKESMLPRLLAPDNQSKKFDPDLEAFFDEAKADSIAVTQLAMSNRRDFSDRLGSIPCPVVVIAGEHDVITPPEEMQIMSNQIPDSTFHLIGGAGHLTPIENPEEFNRLLLEQV